VGSPSSPPADLIDLYAAGEHLGVDPATLRKWIERYRLHRYGTENRRGLYSLADLYDAERQARKNLTRTP